MTGCEEVYTETEVTYEDGRKGMRSRRRWKLRDAAVVA